MGMLAIVFFFALAALGAEDPSKEASAEVGKEVHGVGQEPGLIQPPSDARPINTEAGKFPRTLEPQLNFEIPRSLGVQLSKEIFELRGRVRRRTLPKYVELQKAFSELEALRKVSHWPRASKENWKKIESLDAKIVGLENELEELERVALPGIAVLGARLVRYGIELEIFEENEKKYFSEIHSADYNAHFDQFHWEHVQKSEQVSKLKKRIEARRAK